MGKLRKSAPATKTRIFEATTRHTRRGPRIVNVPVHESQTPHARSRTTSPSKKRTWSPDTYDDECGSPTDPDPKRSRHSGKVRPAITILPHILNTILQTQNDYLREYLDKRQELLIELLRHESPPRNSTCTMCNSTAGVYRCKDCFLHHFLCGACCVSAHNASPFHRIQRFNGDYFERYDLDDLGLALDLREHTHECISAPQDMSNTLGSDHNLSEDDGDNNELPAFFPPRRNRSTRSKLIIVSSTGIFKRSVTWCTCANSPEPYIQLLRASLFPGSFVHPETAFTFDVLDHFRIDALECKTAAMNFMSKIVRISNEAFPSEVPVRILVDFLKLPI